jgi:hypothetical protein
MRRIRPFTGPPRGGGGRHWSGHLPPVLGVGEGESVLGDEVLLVEAHPPVRGQQHVVVSGDVEAVFPDVVPSVGRAEALQRRADRARQVRNHIVAAAGALAAIAEEVALLNQGRETGREKAVDWIYGERPPQPTEAQPSRSGSSTSSTGTPVPAAPTAASSTSSTAVCQASSARPQAVPAACR